MGNKLTISAFRATITDWALHAAYLIHIWMPSEHYYCIKFWKKVLYVYENAYEANRQKNKVAQLEDSELECCLYKLTKHIICSIDVELKDNCLRSTKTFIEKKEVNKIFSDRFGCLMLTGTIARPFTCLNFMLYTVE